MFGVDAAAAAADTAVGGTPVFLQSQLSFRVASRKKMIPQHQLQIDRGYVGLPFLSLLLLQ